MRFCICLLNINKNNIDSRVAMINILQLTDKYILRDCEIKLEFRLAFLSLAYYSHFPCLVFVITFLDICLLNHSPCSHMPEFVVMARDLKVLQVADPHRNLVIARPWRGILLPSHDVRSLARAKAKLRRLNFD